MKNPIVLGLLALVAGTVSAGAQTAHDPALVPSLPAAPRQGLGADVAPERAPGADLAARRVFSIRLNSVKASLMASWLDQKLQSSSSPDTLSTLRLLRQAPVPSPTPAGFTLPTGVGRIVAIDPENTLLVFGTAEGARKLSETVALLDRPARLIDVECTAFWLDVDAPGLAKWKGQAPQTRVVSQGEQDELNALVQAQQAQRFVLPPVRAQEFDTGYATLPFERDFNYAAFDSSRFFVHPDIDPDFAHPGTRDVAPRNVVPRDDNYLRLQALNKATLELSPLVQGDDLSLGLSLGSYASLTRAHLGDTLAVSGSARLLGLTPPSGLSSTCVLLFTPRLQRAAK